MNKYLVEFIGTFFLVLTIGMVVIEPGAGALAPLAIGSMLAVMVYAGGHISGGHYNPAVTLAVWLRGKSTAGRALAYMAVQIVASVVAAFIALFMKGNPAVSGTTLDPAPALIGEFLFTFALAFVVLNVATAKATEGNSYFGFAIGFTLVVAIYSLASVSGGAINPAVGIGITVMGLSSLGNLWVYLLATFLGGAAAALAFRGLHPSDG